DHLHAATFEGTLNPGESLTFVASTENQPNLDGAATLQLRHAQEQKLIQLWQALRPANAQQPPAWITQLVL
ncbi:MAG TPA: glycogen debranching protein, partial [Cyanobacteria bacterium UBA11049]|nr:glycogen debranching protein [Cyanobacteria bacterium UBA11049]